MPAPRTPKRFSTLDVFTEQRFEGNPLAVVENADDLSAGEMQRIAAWTNLSETTFVLKPTVAQPAYRLRIFTPTHELPFAGHPTIGSCHAVLEARARIREGDRIGDPLEQSKLFPPMVVHMIGVGEESGSLDFMLQKIADFYESEVEATLASLTAALEPIMAWFAVSLPLSAAFSRRRREVSSARPITTISWSMLKGFSMKS